MSEFIKIVENNMLINFPVGENDIRIAEDIWEPNLGFLKVKTMRQKPIQVRDSIIPKPLYISPKYKQIALCDDVINFNTIAFFLSIYKHLYFRNDEFLEVQKADNFMMAINNINTLY